MADAAVDPTSDLMIVAAAALRRSDGRILLQRRPEGRPMAGLWEFPGGKLEPGETPEAALARELVEELGIVAAASAMVPLAFAGGQAGARPLLLLLYLIEAWEGDPVARHAAALRWVRPEAMTTLPMPPADVPLVAALARTAGPRAG